MINVDELSIANVSQQYWNKRSIDINFDLNNMGYQLHVSQDKKGVFFPTEIFHITNIQQCPYCDGSEAGCDGLKKYKKDFFHRLIGFPSIRLEWLYLAYEPKKETH